LKEKLCNAGLNDNVRKRSYTALKWRR